MAIGDSHSTNGAGTVPKLGLVKLYIRNREGVDMENSIVIETRFHGPTDSQGARIEVINTSTGEHKWHHWDHEVGYGPAQHLHAAQTCTEGLVFQEGPAGETKMSYLWVARRKG